MDDYHIFKEGCDETAEYKKRLKVTHGILYTTLPFKFLQLSAGALNIKPSMTPSAVFCCCICWDPIVQVPPSLEGSVVGASLLLSTVKTRVPVFHPARGGATDFPREA